MDHAWISIIAAIGAFSVALESIYLGYRLFLASATGEFKFEASVKREVSALKVSRQDWALYFSVPVKRFGLYTDYYPTKRSNHVH